MKSLPEEELTRRQQNHNDYCNKHKLPNFLYGGSNCWSCGKNVFEEYKGTSHVTGCPFCYRSFCD